MVYFAAVLTAADVVVSSDSNVLLYLHLRYRYAYTCVHIMCVHRYNYEVVAFALRVSLYQ